MDLLLIRHGESRSNLSQSAGPPPDGGLTERGRRQAEAVAGHLCARRPAMLLTSTLRRAAETGAIIAEACGLPLTCDDRLREVGTCWPNGRPIESRLLPTRWPVGAPSTRPTEPAWGASESWVDFVGRVGRFLDSMIALARGQRLATVTHSGVIDAVCDIAFGAGIPRRVEVASGHGSITHWEYSGATPEPWLLHGVNLCDHLGSEATAPLRVPS